jgi:hypothetical protein
VFGRHVEASQETEILMKSIGRGHAKAEPCSVVELKAERDE